MLSGKAFTGGHGYCENHLKANDYYEKDKSVTGRWVGEACEDFGIKEGSEVKEKIFELLRDNIHPGTGEQLTKRRNTTRTVKVTLGNEVIYKEIANRRSFYDFTVSAPKTFSVMGVTFKDSRIRKWHNKAVLKTVKELENYTARQDHEIEGIKRTGKFCAARYKHDANRSLEPQLHDHIIIFNATPDEDSGCYALESGEFFKRCRYLTAVYRDELASLALDGGYDIEFDRHGAPQIKDMHDMVEHFSTRTAVIEEHIQRIEDTLGSTLTSAQKKSVSFVTRGFNKDKFDSLWKRNNSGGNWNKTEFFDKYIKLVGSCSDGGLIETTTQSVIDNQLESLSKEQLFRVLELRSKSVKRELGREKGKLHNLEISNIRESLEYAREHLFERKSVVREHEMLETVISHSSGRGTDLKQMKSFLNYQLEDNKLIKIDDEIASVDHLELEKDLISRIISGSGQFESHSIYDFKISEKLNKEQHRTVKELLECRDRFSALVGKAGTGKTFAVSEIVRGNIENGYPVFLYAPSNGARDVLRSYGKTLGEEYDQPRTAEPFEKAVSLQKVLLNKSEQDRITENSLLVLDESGLASLKQFNAFCKLAEKKNCRVLFVGDTGQHVSVEAGDGFRIALKYSNMTRYSLKNIQRQKKSAMKGRYRQIAIDFAFGRVHDAFSKLDRLGAIIEVKNKERYERFAEEYIKAVECGKSVIVVNATHRENELASEKIRDHLKARGVISDERKFTVHKSLNWTNAQKRNPNNYLPGMVLDVTYGREKGQCLSVIDANDRYGIVAENSKGEYRFFKPEKSMYFDVCEKKEIALGAGDTVMLKKSGRSIDGEYANGEIIKIAGFDSSENIITEDNRKITSRRLTYGYASTSHKVQGKTTETVLIGFDRYSVRFADRKTAYVAGTRGIEEIKIFCENKQDLLKIADKSGDRKSVHEMIEQKRQTVSKVRRSTVVQALVEFGEKLKYKLDEFIKVLQNDKSLRENSIFTLEQQRNTQDLFETSKKKKRKEKEYYVPEREKDIDRSNVFDDLFDTAKKEKVKKPEAPKKEIDQSIGRSREGFSIGF